MRKFLKTMAYVTISAILTVAIALLMIGCNKTSSNSVEIFDTPKTVYIQGQEFDLSVGSIIEKTKDGVNEIKFSSSKVSVSGFEKDTLGEQEITVKYGKVVLTYVVTVVPQMEVLDFVSSYFVGDELDLSKGTVKIALENGTQKTVLLSDSSISVEGFNSESENKALELTVKYTDGETVFTTTVDVAVHSREIVELISTDLRVEYMSHETVFDVSGGYLQVTSEDGKRTENVELTQEMISDFDPSQASVENDAENPFRQVLFVNYGTKSFPLEIRVIYSDVSAVKAIAQNLLARTKNTNWFQSNILTVSVSSTLGENALQAIEDYFNFTEEEKSFVSVEETEVLARYTTRYAFEKFDKMIVEDGKSIFEMLTVEIGQGYGFTETTSYESAKKDSATLKDENLSFNKFVNKLTSVMDTFGEVTIGSSDIDYYLTQIPLGNDRELVVEMLDLLVYVYDEISFIPAEWDLDVLESNKEHIINSALKIVNSQFTTPNFSGFFDSMSSWRENDDVFDIIYYYYTYGDGMDVNTIFLSVCRPEPVEELFGQFNILFNHLLSGEMIIFQGFEGTPDNTSFFVIYDQTMDLYESILSGDNQFYKDILSKGGFDNLVLINVGQNLNYDGKGFYSFAGGVAEDGEFNDLIDLYGDIIMEVYNTGLFDKEKVPYFFDKMVSLTPATLYGFFSSLYDGYKASQPNGRVFFEDTGSEQYKSFFLAYMLLETYSSEAIEHIVTNFLSAIETWSLRFVNAEAEVAFREIMGYVIDEYGKLSDANKTVFNNSGLKSAYDKYVAIYNKLDVYTNNAQTIALGDYEDEFETIEILIKDINSYASTLKAYKKGKIPYDETALIISAYEKLKAIKDDILTNAGAEIVEYYCYQEVRDLGTTYDYAVINALSVVNERLITAKVSIGGISTNYARSVYLDVDFDGYLAEVYDVLKAGKKDTELTDSQIKWALESFTELSEEAKIAFRRIGGESLVLKVLTDYSVELSVEEQEFVTAFIEVQNAYLEYLIDEKTINSFNEFVLKLEDLIEKQTAVKESALYNNCLKAVYEYYVSLNA